MGIEERKEEEAKVSVNNGQYIWQLCPSHSISMHENDVLGVLLLLSVLIQWRKCCGWGKVAICQDKNHEEIRQCRNFLRILVSAFCRSAKNWVELHAKIQLWVSCQK